MAEFDAAAVRSLQPVGVLPEKAPEDGIGLCLSGGGYRAMLFHLGTLWRLNDGGLLRRLDRISSVSGGSITAAMLGLHWQELEWDARGQAENFERMVVRPVRVLAGETIDASSVLEGLLPFTSVGERVAAAYREHLFAERDPAGAPRGRRRAAVRALRDQPRVRRVLPLLAALPRGLPRRDGARAAGAARRGGRRVVGVPAGALAVRARPARRRVGDRGGQRPRRRRSGAARSSSPTAGSTTTSGLETVWRSCRTVLISDGGGQAADDADPPADWPRQILRVLKVIDNQVRELRKRQAIGSYRAGLRRRDLLGDPLRGGRLRAGRPARVRRRGGGRAGRDADAPARARAGGAGAARRLGLRHLRHRAAAVAAGARRRPAREAALQLTGRALAQANASRGRRRLRRVRAGWPSARARRHSTIVSPVGMSHSTYRMV